jgi:hypothetical protein
MRQDRRVCFVVADYQSVSVRNAASNRNVGDLKLINAVSGTASDPVFKERREAGGLLSFPEGGGVRVFESADKLNFDGVPSVARRPDSFRLRR